jgi:hypothetical protein
MRLRKTTDINLTYMTVYELLNELEEPMFSVWKTDSGEFRVAGCNWESSTESLTGFIEQAITLIKNEH